MLPPHTKFMPGKRGHFGMGTKAAGSGEPEEESDEETAAKSQAETRTAIHISVISIAFGAAVP